MTTPVLDELDHRIIGVLSKDARVSNRRIAALLGVTEGTIRSRIKRLEQDNLIRLTAVTNVASVGGPKVVLIWIQAAHSDVKDLCDKLAAMPEIRSVIILLGRCDILAVGLFTSLEDVIAVANNRILALPGVRHVETSIAVKTLKYDIRAARITRRLARPRLDEGLVDLLSETDRAQRAADQVGVARHVRTRGVEIEPPLHQRA